jgi:hypothetical protein
VKGTENWCVQYYCSVYDANQSTLTNSQALDQCLHQFLDQRPTGKKYTAFDRASSLAAAPFWRDKKAVRDSELSSLALSRILRFDNAISTDLLIHLATHNPDTLRWAIRYSKLFTRTDSPLWAALRSNVDSEDWQVFFGVCDRLLDQLNPFDEIIGNAESQLKCLSLLELFSYLSIVAYAQLAEPITDKERQKEWEVFNRIITRKLTTCSEDDFNVSEQRLGLSLRKHLSPILFPSEEDASQCHANLQALAVLISATQERIDYEGSIDWFCFDPECRYQLKPGESVIFNASDEGSKLWQRTEQKSQLLWHYWMSRGMLEFADSSMAQSVIGSPENHDANQLAAIKAFRSVIQLQKIYGLGDRVTVQDGSEVELYHLLLATELTSAFFRQAFIQPFAEHYRRTGDVSRSLTILAMQGLREGENRFPFTWSESKQKIDRITGWTVSEKHPKGSAESAKSILAFWTCDMKALSKQIQQNPRSPTPKLYEQPFYKIGRYSFQFPWIVAQQNNLTATANNFRRVNSRREELRAETLRVEQSIADLFRDRGFSVVVGLKPPAGDDDVGEMDVICHRDGTVLLFEVKSGYIRSSQNEIWLHRTNTLRKAARQLKRNQATLLTLLETDADLRDQLGCTGSVAEQDLITWIVDTSIEFDEQIVDGFRVVSREVLEVVLRDEKHLLRPLDQEPSESAESLFPAGFSPQAFVEVIESGAVWNELR